jgi:hypothetical protein
MSRSSDGSERLLPMKKPAQNLIAEVARRQPQLEMTIGTDLGDVWSHYCTLNRDGDVVGRGRFRTTPKGIEKGFDRARGRTEREGSRDTLDLDWRATPGTRATK